MYYSTMGVVEVYTASKEQVAQERVDVSRMYRTNLLDLGHLVNTIVNAKLWHRPKLAVY